MAAPQPGQHRCSEWLCPSPLAMMLPPSQGLLCLFCSRWEEVTLKMGCPATPTCSTTTSHFHHNPAPSLTSTGSRTRTAVRQLCSRARLGLACHGGDSGHPLGPALCSSSLGGEMGALARLLCSIHRAVPTLSLFQRFSLSVPVPSASSGCTEPLGPALLSEVGPGRWGEEQGVVAGQNQHPSNSSSCRPAMQDEAGRPHAGDAVQQEQGLVTPPVLCVGQAPPTFHVWLRFLSRLVRGAGAKQCLLGSQRNKEGREGGRGEHVGGR